MDLDSSSEDSNWVDSNRDYDSDDSTYSICSCSCDSDDDADFIHFPLSCAFEKMRESGIFAAHNFCCCDSCGRRELEETDGEAGYAFYHAQSTDIAAATGELHIGYASYWDSFEDDVEIGETIASCLRETGYDVVWDGLAETKILVKLNASDIRLCQRMAWGSEWVAKLHYLRRLWSAFTAGLEQDKSDMSQLQDLVMAWACLPKGPLYKRACKRFETSSMAGLL